jgi:hypothetical protein
MLKRLYYRWIIFYRRRIRCRRRCWKAGAACGCCSDLWRKVEHDYRSNAQ